MHKKTGEMLTVFGYVRIFRPELKIREEAAYRGVYCGLCRCMGRRTGCLSRMTLSYDFVFLAILRAALTGDTFTMESRRCAVHPTKKEPAAAPCPSLEYAARAAALLQYEKGRDDLRDSRGLRKLAARMMLPSLRRAAARAGLPELSRILRDKLDALSGIEKQALPSVDTPAGLFGELLGEVFAFGLEGNQRRLAYSAGFHTGRWIYEADAADDREKDRKSGSYNPYLLLWDKKPDGTPESDDTMNADIRLALNLESGQIAAAVALMDFSSIPAFAPITDNILRLGMPATARAVTGGSADSSTPAQTGTDPG